LSSNLVAVDIGNSRMKLGRFVPATVFDKLRPEEATAPTTLPEPVSTFDLPIAHATGDFDVDRLAEWCDEQVDDAAAWRIASVHRGAAERLTAVVGELSKNASRRWSLQQLTYRDLSLVIEVEAPERVGIDRLLAAGAANRLRRQKRAAIVVDVGTAITVDLVNGQGAFCGGAILPGIAMSARALEAETDALPRVDLDHLAHPPAALGKSTVPAIESGLYWGAVGAIRELIHRLAEPHGSPPDVFLTGGASADVAEVLSASEKWPVRHVPHLVLAGIALAGNVES
jgi:type III pantothenate kinase